MLYHVAVWSQAELEGKATDSLRSLGICSGDTLWLMLPASETQLSSPHHQGSSEPSRLRPEASEATPSTADAEGTSQADTDLASLHMATDAGSDQGMAQLLQVNDAGNQ